MENKFLKYTLLIMFIIFSIFIHYMAKKPPPSVPGNFSAEKATDLKLETIDGQEVNLNDYTGEKPLLLYFWNTKFSFIEITDKTIEILEKKIDDKNTIEGLKSLKDKKFQANELYNTLFMMGLDKNEMDLAIKLSNNIPVCAKSLDELEKFYKKQEENLDLLALNAGDVRLELKKFLEDKNYSFPVLLDTKTYIKNPSLILMDKDGKIIEEYKQINPEDDFSEILENNFSKKVEQK